MFFFFKQKTAYEMRISDWSSDVCSSDLCDLEVAVRARAEAGPRHLAAVPDVAGARCGLGRAGGDHDPPRRLPDALRGRIGRLGGPEIGRASCRERVCQYV